MANYKIVDSDTGDLIRDTFTSDVWMGLIREIIVGGETYVIRNIVYDPEDSDTTILKVVKYNTNM